LLLKIFNLQHLHKFRLAWLVLKKDEICYLLIVYFSIFRLHFHQFFFMRVYLCSY